MAGLSCEGLIDASSEWMDSAACKGQGFHAFFVERGGPLHEAHSFCRSCPVQQECLDYAVTNGISHGMWGNVPPRVRRSMPRSDVEADPSSALWAASGRLVEARNRISVEKEAQR